MSVGHVARLLEEAGTPTVIIGVAAFRNRLAAMRVPRLLLTPHPMGRPIGAPGDAAGQMKVLRAALALLENATAGGTVWDFDGRYLPDS